MRISVRILVINTRNLATSIRLYERYQKPFESLARMSSKAGKSSDGSPDAKKPRLEAGSSGGQKSLVKQLEADRAAVAASILDFDFIKKRVRILSDAKEMPEKSNGVLYWMTREMRVQDNWSFLFAQKLALKNDLPLHVCFCLLPKFMDATIRHYKFLLKGLEEVEAECTKLNITFHLLQGDSAKEVPKFFKANKFGAMIVDFSPLRLPLEWIEKVKKALPYEAPLIQVDAHNIVPIWVTSEKQEYAARTIRNKVNGNLPTYLTKFPPLIHHKYTATVKADPIDWDDALNSVQVDRTVEEVDWAQPGYKAGIEMLQSFCDKRSKRQCFLYTYFLLLSG